MTCPVPGCSGHQDGTLTDWLSQHQLGDLATTTILELLRAALQETKGNLPQLLGPALRGEVWLVRDPAETEPRVAAIYPSQAAADEFTSRLEHAGRHLITERWDVPGHD